jgi:Holliday junction DNA helicase RuvA
MALAILSGMKPEGIRAAIGRNDLTAFTRISGVGKKTAERIVLELRDKIGQIGLTAELPASPGTLTTGSGAAFDEAMAALLALGYQQGEVLTRLRNHMTDGITAESLIRAVLREMGGR